MDDHEILLAAGGGYDDNGRKYFLTPQGKRYFGHYHRFVKYLLYAAPIVWLFATIFSGGHMGWVFTGIYLAGVGFLWNITGDYRHFWDESLGRERKIRAELEDHARVRAMQQKKQPYGDAREASDESLRRAGFTLR